MISQTPIFDAVEKRAKENDKTFKTKAVKVEVKKPIEMRRGIFKGTINFETRRKIASFTVWEREIIQIEVLILDIESRESKIAYDGEASNCEKVLELFDKLCDSMHQ